MVVRPHIGARSMLARRVQPMQITFVRSGGLAAMPGLSVQGTVDLGDARPQVTSESARYQRELTAREIEQLQAAADPATLSRAKTALAARPTTARDAYQYDVTLAPKGGRPETVTFNATGGDDIGRVAPALGHLVQWIDSEAQRIVAHRLKSR
jgi:hypothetical protein